MLDKQGLTAGGWATPEWNEQLALDMMNVEGIATAILSLSAPGVHFGDDAQARTLAREINEFGADLVTRMPTRFGLFACLPLPDTPGAIAEAVYALDSLKADGVVLLSNFGGRYLGDDVFEPLWHVLDDRSAVVFIHPTDPPIARIDGLPSPLLDYPFDTTRTALHMVVKGVMRRHPRMKVILSHAGGFVPFVAYRFAGAAAFNPGTTPDGILADMRTFYFDTALSSTVSALPSLLTFADPTRITFGSDFPYAAVSASQQMNAVLDNYVMTNELHVAINRSNAEALFSRLVKK